MELYPYQKRITEILTSGKSVVLQAPTGSGKTIAALWPFLESWKQKTLQFPKKCVYVVPMRVLAHQFILSTTKLVSDELRIDPSPRITVQTGDQTNDNKFEGDLIFCTVDQFLSGYLMMPYGLPRRLANINAGIGVGTYLVFDEFHLLDPDSTLKTAWIAIKQFKKYAPVLIMTATFSKKMLAELARDLGAEVVTISQEEASQIENRLPASKPRQRVWETSKDLLTAEAVMQKQQRRSLVLCNTVHRAQKMYREIRDIVEKEKLPIHTMLLHSRFLPEDRRKIEGDLQKFFGKESANEGVQSVIAIATQTIEVGVDITSDILHTELAPASSLIQRAGRCARYPGEQGQVIIYPVDKFAPYGNDKDGKAWKTEMQNAFEWLQNHSNQVFDFQIEQDLVNAVATPRDGRVLQDLFAGQPSRREEIIKALNGNQTASDGRLLIRDAESCKILIHPEPDSLLKNPKAAIGFSLQPTSLYGYYNDWQERARYLDLDWAVKFLFESPNDKNEENRSDYQWRPLNDPSLIPGARLIIVNPALAGYDPSEGFLPNRGGTDFISTLPGDSARQTWEGYSYQLESYEEHIWQVYSAFETHIRPYFEYPAEALERASGWPPGSLVKAARLVCVLHDAGKLNISWQAWARAHQSAVGNPIQASFAAAHTDTDNNDPDMMRAAKEAAKSNPKPPHAAEGAMAVAPILFSLFKEQLLAQAALTAIARHHTPFTGEYKAYTLESTALSHIAATLNILSSKEKRELSVDVINRQATSNPSFRGLMITPEQEYGWMAYTLLVRALRQADQLGTAKGSNKVDYSIHAGSSS